MIIRQKYGLIAILLFLGFISTVYSQNNWEGTAVVGRYGEFPPGGLYVASNAFPLNSMVSVTNAQTGKTARLIVAKTVDDPGVFMLLSEDAAGELGVTSEDTVDVRVEPVQLPGLTRVNPNQDLPFHPDPDVNPAASLGDPNASIIQPGTPSPAVTAVPDVDTAAPDVDTAAPEATEPADETASAESTAPELEGEGPPPAPTSSLSVIAAPRPEEEEESGEPSTDPASNGIDDADDDEPATVESIEPPDEDTDAADTVAVDESDFVGNGAVVGSAPAIADQLLAEAGEPEVSMPRVNPAAEPPLSVDLVLPRDVDPETRAAAPEIPAEGDPLAERLAAVEDELDADRVADAPLPGPSEPDTALSGTVIAEVSPEATIPNPVRVVIELPEADDVDGEISPEVTPAPPAAPDVGPGEIALPLVPVAEPDEEPGEESDEPESVADAVVDGDTEGTTEPLRPEKIPEDVIITLEPAEFRSPDPEDEPPAPEPEVEPTPAEEIAAASETAAPEDEGRDERGDAVDEDDETESEAVEEAEVAPSVPAEPVQDVDDESWARENLPLITGLRSGASYVQVAAFTNPRSAKMTVEQIGPRYPVAVLPQRGTDHSIYRIFVGPLSEDEKGSALYAIRNRGYRDAFVREQP